MKSRLLIVLSVITAVATAGEASKEISRRNSKLFPFLAVVSFPNTKCSDPTMGDGLCYTSSQCTRNGGVVSGSTCAQMYGVCCIFKQSCSGTPAMLTVRNNITQLVGQAGTAQPCQIKIPRQPGVCQLRLDFNVFNVGTANSEANCPNDFVSFTSDNLPNSGLILCGVASGQHLYLHYGSLDTISINTNLASMGSSYAMEVTMIKCDSMERAPDGCTQYFTAPTAEVQSFNFPVQQLNSELYTVCVKSTIGQTIQWSPCAGANSTFSISGAMSQAPANVGKSGDDCPLDFVYIPPGNKICGTNLTQSLPPTNLQPFFIVVNFDVSEIPIPTGPLDPDTGCPLGFDCSLGPGVKCMDGDTCLAPPFFFTSGLIDAFNQGFCLRYSIT